MSFKLGDILKVTPTILTQEDRCVTGKRVFYSKVEAQTSGYNANAKNRQRSAMKAYRCDFCAWFHLGHRR